MIKANEQFLLVLTDLWFVYGNKGKKHTSGNHYFLQKMIEDIEQGKNLKSIDAYRIISSQEGYTITEGCYSNVKEFFEEHYAFVKLRRFFENQKAKLKSGMVKRDRKG